MSRRSGEHYLEVELNAPLTAYDYAVEWVLGLALIVSPFWYGATGAAGQQVLFVLVALLALLVGAKYVSTRGARFVFTWAYLPMLLYLLVVCLSVIALPAGIVRSISPGTFEEKERLLSDNPNVSVLLAKLTISFNVWNSQRGLRLVLAASVIFATVANVYQTPAQIKRLLATIATAGLLVTLLTLAQNITHESGQPYRIYWDFTAISVQAPHPNAGPFPGKAQLGQYLNLTIGSMVALMLVRIGEGFRGEDLSGREIFERAGRSTIQTTFFLLVVIITALGTLAWSFSRGAMLGAILGGATASILILIKRGWRKGETIVLINLLLLISIVLVCVYLLLDSKFNELAGTTAVSGTVRWNLVKSMPSMFRSWPVFGTGLETFEWMFPLFQPKDTPGFFVYAENDWLQMFTDTGVVGGVLVLAFIAILIRMWVGAFRGRNPIHLASIGIAMAIVAIMIHSVTDFSQHAPAVATVTAVLLGLTVSLNRLATRSTQHSSQAPRFGWSPWPRLAIASAVVAAMVWSVWTLDKIRQAESLSYESDFSSSSFKASWTDPDFMLKRDEYYDPAIDADEEAARLDPNNVLYIHYLNHFRWRKLSAKRDPVTTAIIYPPNAKVVAEKIVTEMSTARTICPCYGKLYTLLGKMQWELLDRSQAVANLETGLALRPSDPEPRFYLAVAAASDGDWEKARQHASLCIEKDGAYTSLLINYFGRECNRYDIAYELVRHNLDALNEFLNTIKDDPAQRALTVQAQSQKLALARKAAIEHPKDGRYWAALAESLQMNDAPTPEVIDAYQKALEFDYGNLGWRIRLARLLKTIGRKDDAENQAEICLRIDPQMAEAKVLLASLKELPPPTPAP